jgi:N-acetylmuramoyl-L-alanine amidase
MRQLISKKHLFIFLVFFLSSAVFSLDLRREIKERKFPSYIIENHTYISLKTALNVIKCEDSYGRIEDRVFVVYKGKEIKFRVDDKNILIGEEKAEFTVPPKEIEGEILVPLKDFERILSDIDRAFTVTAGAQKPSGEQQPKESKDFIILLDPGHGGKDAGAIGNFGLKEKDVNLDVALRLRDYLLKKLQRYPHVKVYATRMLDIYLSLEERVRMAENYNIDIFFSIHTNSARYNKYKVTGFETYYPGIKKEIAVLPPPSNPEGIEESLREDSVVLQIIEDLNVTTTLDESRILAEIVQEKLAQRLLTPDRGAKRGNFYVLKYTPMISVLIEIGFICNPNIELNLRDIEVRQAIANALGNSIIDYIQSKGIIKTDE